jgi:hypothetical protein
MKTVLIITASFDPQADLLIAELRRRSVPCVRWNTYEFPLSSLLTYRVSNSGFGAEIISDGRTIDLASIGSVWWQWDQPAGFPAGLNPAERRFAEREAELAVNALPAIGRFAWINHPTCERLANSKAAQLFAARTVGLEIPRTVITNNPAEVRAFIATAPGQIVYKASSPPRNIAPDKALFTGLVTDETLTNLDLIRITPGIFQERIGKSYELRITVIGARIFAVKIDSQALAETQLDWRHAQHDVAYEPVTLPREIAAKITAFMEALGLVYGAFDFIVTPDGRYVFLEVNPGGAYMWVEAATGLGITPAPADALIEPCQT